MKVSQNFVLREIAGEYILVPIGTAAARFNGLITLNETARTIFLALQKEPQTLDSLTAIVTNEYEISAQEAKSDIEDFLSQLNQIGALEEG